MMMKKTLYPVLNGLQSMLMITLLSSLLLIADSNFVMDGRLSSGTYTIDGNQVTFNNFIIKYMGSFEYRYTNATISGSAMTVTYYMKHTTSSNWGTAETDNFSKR